MKIGIITIHNSPNYGASLQAYALWKYINDLGHDVEIIDLYRPYQKEYVASSKFYKMRDSASKKLFSSKVKIVLKKLLKINVQSNLFSYGSKKKFDEFNSLLRYSRAYTGPDELYENPPIYDLYISGSDQLWNPTQPYSLEPYFLTFAPKDSRKISYATSIGVSDLKEEEKEKFKLWLSSYTGISVREKQAKVLLEQITGRIIEQVADPTFLLAESHWKIIARFPSEDRPYILLFTLTFSRDMLEYALRLSKESGLALVVLNQIQPECRDSRYKAVRDAGPREFLGYIAAAEMVITDSFHCSVFSLILGARNFYSYIAPTNNRGTRILDLLSTYSLSDHLLNTNLNESFATLSSRKIDSSHVRLTIEVERVRSQKFLRKHLNG